MHKNAQLSPITNAKWGIYNNKFQCITRMSNVWFYKFIVSTCVELYHGLPTKYIIFKSGLINDKFLHHGTIFQNVYST
jgi:hypothetical protein